MLLPEMSKQTRLRALTYTDTSDTVNGDAQQWGKRQEIFKRVQRKWSTERLDTQNSIPRSCIIIELWPTTSVASGQRESITAASATHPGSVLSDLFSNSASNSQMCSLNQPEKVSHV